MAYPERRERLAFVPVHQAGDSGGALIAKHLLAYPVELGLVQVNPERLLLKFRLRSLLFVAVRASGQGEDEHQPD